MNRYFLGIACLQLISIITPVNPISTFGPLIVIFGISAAKELVDDRQRAAADKLANQRECNVLRNGVFQPVPSSDINVGDIVRLYEDDQVPCDLLLLHTSNPLGICFVQTANLDGETNLKKKFIPSGFGSNVVIEDFRGICECSSPNANVYSFDSRLWITPKEKSQLLSGDAISINVDQLLQQTIRIKNTEHVTGLAVYTGNQTKFSMNKDVPPLKWTLVDALVNKLAIILFIFQLGLVVVFGGVGLSWKSNNGLNHSYLWYRTDESWYEFIIIPARFLLLNSTIIPISLKVTLDFCKLFYAKLINWDAELHEPGEEPARANNTSINENLGQIQYVLSDKTGTLTENVMSFQYGSIGGNLFSLDEKGNEKVFSLSDAVKKRQKDPLLFLLNIALNNGIIPEKTQSGKIIYKGASPDEEALVRAAAEAGVTLISKDGPNVDLSINGEIRKYVLLQELEFTSDRRRSSMVVRDLATGALILYCKGGDDRIFERLAPGQDKFELESHLDRFSKDGLRTLVFGYKDLEEKEFMEWAHTFKQANNEVEDREKCVAAACELIETSIYICGASAIEDRLQRGVPETIANLREAGIRFWMLTGDKYNTALQIATATNLRKPDGPYSKLYDITGSHPEEVLEKLTQYLADVKELVPRDDYDICVVLAGSVVPFALDPMCKQKLLELTLLANSVVCCRVAPRQKAEMVNLVKNDGKMTLAIGDGGNDVSMIQAAHIGVGIRGKEGLQAARASDFQFNYFRYLNRLLLVHGRYSYIRSSFVSQYSYYKSFLFCFFQIVFGFLSGFSGSSLFNSACITAYNSVLFFPIVTFVFDRDISPRCALENPRCYRPCIQGESFTLGSYGLWMLRGFYQGIVMFVFLLGIYGVNYHHAADGTPADYESIGVMFFCVYLWVQTFTLLLELKSITWINLVVIWGFHFLTLLCLQLFNTLIGFNSLLPLYSATHVFIDPVFWLASVVVTVIAVAPVTIIQILRFNYYPSFADRLRYQEITEDKNVSSIQ